MPSSWPEVIEILARHAARCLEAQTAQKSAATTPSSPRFWVPPTGKAGGAPVARMPMSLRTRAELFHQELVATLAGGDPTLLGFQA